MAPASTARTATTSAALVVRRSGARRQGRRQLRVGERSIGRAIITDREIDAFAPSRPHRLRGDHRDKSLVVDPDFGAVEGVHGHGTFNCAPRSRSQRTRLRRIIASPRRRGCPATSARRATGQRGLIVGMTFIWALEARRSGVGRRSRPVRATRMTAGLFKRTGCASGRCDRVACPSSRSWLQAPAHVSRIVRRAEYATLFRLRAVAVWRDAGWDVTVWSAPRPVLGRHLQTVGMVPTGMGGNPRRPGCAKWRRDERVSR
jgi:hypothetical protein